MIKEKEYLFLNAADNPSQNILKFVPKVCTSRSSLENKNAQRLPAFNSSYPRQKQKMLLAIQNRPEAEFTEFEPRLKFKPRMKYGWFHLKSYSMFQDFSRRSIETGFWGIQDAAKIHYIRTLQVSLVLASL